MVNGVTDQVIEKLSEFPPEMQQEVVDFVEFLSLKLRERTTETTAQPKHSDFYKEHVSQYAGCADGGPTDLSTNKAHMKDFGRDSMGKDWEPPKEPEGPVSFAEAARDYIGCLDGGPTDLSTNKAYLKGLGEV